MSAAARAKLSRALRARHRKKTGPHTHRTRKAGTRHVAHGVRKRGKHSGATRRHPAYGKGATRFHRARKQVEHARRHHARRQLLRAKRHSARHQRTRNYKVHKPKRPRRGRR